MHTHIHMNGGNISRVVCGKLVAYAMEDDVELCHRHRSSTSLEMIRKYIDLEKEKEKETSLRC